MARNSFNEKPYLPVAARLAARQSEASQGSKTKVGCGLLSKKVLIALFAEFKLPRLGRKAPVHERRQAAPTPQ